MSDYVIRILLQGDDRASGPIGNVGRALGSMGTVAGGIIGADLLMNIGRGLAGIITGSVGATAGMQAMQVGLEGLIAKELAQGETVRQLTQEQVNFTTQQKIRLLELQGAYSGMQGEVSRLTNAYNEQVSAHGENSQAALALKLQIEGLQVKVHQAGSELNYLKDASDGTVNVMREMAVGTMTLAEAMPLAQGKAKDLMNELANIAILSPYQVSTIQNTFRTAMAFGYTTEQAKKYTTAILNVAAGTGATNDMMNRMAYNFAQIRMQGRITGVDIRQLSMAGFDLVGVLRYMGKELGINIQTHDDFNRALAAGQISWDQFTDLFAKYADENFGGAAERMAKTLQGLQSTFADVFTLTMPTIMGPAVEKFTEFAGGILDSFLKIRDSDLLTQWGESLGNMMGRVIGFLEPIVGYFEEFFTLLSQGMPVGAAFKTMLLNIFGPSITAQVFEVVRVFQGLVGGFVEFGIQIRPVITQIAEFIGNNVRLVDVFVAIGLIIASSVIPAFLSMVAAFAPILALVGVIALVRTAWQNNWYGIRDTLTGVWQTNILPALQQLWTWLQINVPIAIQTVSNYWTTTMLPALQTAWGWVQINVLPLLSQLWTWLQVNVPLAIQTVSNFWSTVLLPAIMNVWNWMQTSLFPVLQTVWDWLAVNIPAAIQTVSDFFTGTMLPNMTSVWEWLTGTWHPFWVAFDTFIGAVLGKTIEAFAGLWSNILQPALDAVVKSFNEHVMPVLTDLWTLVSESLFPALQEFGTWLSDTFVAAWNGLNDALKGATDWFTSMASEIDKLELPAWLIPGSPTPFEIGLRGINREMSKLAGVNLPSMKIGLELPRGALAAPGANGGGGGNVSAYVEGDTYNDILVTDDAGLVMSNALRDIQRGNRLDRVGGVA